MPKKAHKYSKCMNKIRMVINMFVILCNCRPAGLSFSLISQASDIHRQPFPEALVIDSADKASGSCSLKNICTPSSGATALRL